MPQAAGKKTKFRNPPVQAGDGESNVRIHGASPLSAVEVFFDLTPEQLAALEQRLITVPVCRGETLIRAGDEADALYLVVSGRFAIDVDGRRVAEVRSGSPIGEIAFFANGRRTATVTALRDSIVLKLLRADFAKLSDEYPTVLKSITVTLARRLTETLSTRERPPISRSRTVAVVGAGPEPLPQEFRSRLSDAFSRTAKILAIDAKMLAEIFPGETEYEFEAVTRWLNQQESRHDYVLYFADAKLTPFSRKAIRQADHVLLVARYNAQVENGNGKPNPLESFAFEVHPPSARTLVLLHDARARIRGTSNWLKSRPVNLHHHVATSDDTDYDRIVRFIGGNATGFVACGGGALCTAHIGVYKALLNAGIKFDLMGGTSGGGALAAAFVMGTSPEDVSKRTAELVRMARKLRRLTWPRYSLLDHTVIDRTLQGLYGRVEIEDLWTGYFTVATCLASNSLCVLTKGPLWKAVRASSSVPGLLPPVYDREGHVLVDGALLDNVPIKSMLALKTGPNVVVNFGIESVKNNNIDYAALPSRNQMLLSLVNPFTRARLPNAPGIATVLLRSLMVRRERVIDTVGPDDLLIVPPLPRDVGVMDWNRHVELSTMAYDYTAKLLDGLRASGHPIFGQKAQEDPPLSTHQAA